MPPIIAVDGLSKAYRIGLKEQVPDTLVGAAQSVLKYPLRNLRKLSRLDTFSQTKEEDDVVWALRDVSFQVREGDVLGIIGRNGAGKSTLLKVLSRITEPTRGRAVIRGRVSSLLEVGTGFHPELTGRENIYMNGTILGMTKREIDHKFDEIVEFSGVEKFLDTPIKRYSSGMQVRLAFSVAAHLEPEILIVDEVLAVGDAEFQKRCLGKMQDVASSGRTVLFVSHNLSAVEQLCSRALLIQHGSVQADDVPEKIIARYLAHSESDRGDLHAARRRGMREVIQKITFSDAAGEEAAAVPAGGELRIRVEYSHSEPLVRPRFGILIGTPTGEKLIFLQTGLQSDALPDLPASGTVECVVPRLPLAPGLYNVTCGCAVRGQQLDLVEDAATLEVRQSNYFQTGRMPDHGHVLTDALWQHPGGPAANPALNHVAQIR